MCGVRFLVGELGLVEGVRWRLRFGREAVSELVRLQYYGMT